MIPLRDENPTRGRALLTLAIIAACIGIYFFVQPIGQATFVQVGTEEGQLDDLEFTYQRAAIPCEVVQGRPLAAEEVARTLSTGDSEACVDDPTSAPLFRGKRVWLAMLTSMFLHGSVLHLAGNMLYLWVFGNNIEDRRGKIGFALFYLVAGIVATGAHVVLQPDSTVPLVGASGAIAGVMGAYLVLFPKAPIHTLLPFFPFFIVRAIPAFVLLGFWFVSQFFINPNSGVAWAAHVGGFVFGVLAGAVWRVTDRRDRWAPGAARADGPPPPIFGRDYDR